MAHHEDIHKAKNNGSCIKKGWHGEWINANEVFLLVANASQSGRHASVRPKANFLIEEMAKGSWIVIAGPHTSESDSTNHITVEANKKRYHLRLDMRNNIFEITTPTIAKDVRPWHAPGQVNFNK